MFQPTLRVAHRDPVVSRNCKARSPFRTRIQQPVEPQRTSSAVVFRFERRTSRIYARKRSTTVPDDLLRETDLRRIARHWKLHSPAIGWMDHTLVREKISRPMPPSITSFSTTVFRSSDALRPFVTQLRSVVSWNSDHRSSARPYMLILRTVHGLETGSSAEPRANDSHSVRSIFVDTIIEVTFYISWSITVGCWNKHQSIENTWTRVRLKCVAASVLREDVATRYETLDRIVTAATTAMPPRRAL